MDELAPLDVDGDAPGHDRAGDDCSGNIVGRVFSAAIMLHGLRAVAFGDGSMMLAMGPSALHLTAKQVAALEAFLAIRERPR
jgi:hypothetical protein